MPNTGNNFCQNLIVHLNKTKRRISDDSGASMSFGAFSAPMFVNLGIVTNSEPACYAGHPLNEVRVGEEVAVSRQRKTLLRMKNEGIIRLDYSASYWRTTGSLSRILPPPKMLAQPLFENNSEI